MNEREQHLMKRIERLQIEIHELKIQVGYMSEADSDRYYRDKDKADERAMRERYGE